MTELTGAAVGIDLGGSNIRWGAVTADGKLRGFGSQLLDRSLGPGELAASLAPISSELAQQVEANGVGLAVAGALGSQDELLPGLHNFNPGFDDAKLAQEFSASTGLPTRIGNDANLAMLAEATFGAARAARSALLLTLGTGIGGGLLLNGELYRGTHSSAVEIGLTRAGHPDSGEIVPVESYASPAAVWKRLGGAQGGDLFELADSGDQRAVDEIGRMYDHLGLLISNIHLLLDLELVVLSGGLAAAGERVAGGVSQAFARHCPAEHQFDLEIVLGELPAEAVGVYGGAALWFVDQ